jgi:hypothetical protein
VAWFFGVLGLYLATVILVAAEKIFGKSKKPDELTADNVSSSHASDFDPADQ